MPDDQTHDIEFRVRYGETDRMGVVYHPEYLVWCELGRTEYIRSLGMAYAEMERRGVPLAVAEATGRIEELAAKNPDRKLKPGQETEIARILLKQVKISLRRNTRGGTIFTGLPSIRARFTRSPQFASSGSIATPFAIHEKKLDRKMRA